MSNGRNDVCLCGSGKKYKKCCLFKPQQDKSQFKATNQKIKHPLLSIVNTADLLQTIAALTVLPQNHGKNYRLEQLTQLAIDNKNSSSKKITVEQLRDLLDGEFSESSYEEIPVNFFTELITNQRGDQLIFPGVTENSTFILSNLLSAIFHWPNSGIPPGFKHNIESVSLLLMTTSNQIGKKLGYIRYMQGEAEDDAIIIPALPELTLAKSAVTVSVDEMDRLLKQLRVPAQALNPFLTQPTDRPNSYNGEPAFVGKPILLIEQQYIIISPATLSKAFNDFIWHEAEKQGISNLVSRAFHGVLWNNLNMELSLMKFKHFQLSIPYVKEIKDLRVSFMQFDDDKIALLQMLNDDGRNFKDPTGANLGVQNAHDYRQFAVKHIRTLPEYKDFQILEIVIISPIGRDIFFPYFNTDHVHSLNFDVADIHALFNSGDTNAIDLWNFASAADKLISKVKKLDIKYFDLLQVYRNHHDSLNLNDSELQLLSLQLGLSADFRRQAILRVDAHSATTLIDGHIAHVPVRRNGKSGPVYMAPGELTHNLIFFVEAFSFPITVSPARERENIPDGLADIYWQTTDAIAYWLWQVSPSVKDFLSSIPMQPLQILFDIDDDDAFLTMKRDYVRQPALQEKFHTDVKGSVIQIMIPSEIIPYLYGADNEGERVLLRVLLAAFNDLLVLHNIPQLSQRVLTDAVEFSAPLGQKKKFFILDSADNMLLDPKDLVPYRLIQDYQVEIIKDSLLISLGKQRPSIGTINKRSKKLQLIKNIKELGLTPQLESTLRKYDSKSLLEKLIGINETLIRKREKMNLMIPTRIACFVSEEQQQEDLIENLSELNQTIIAVRCLIERIIAEPYNGRPIISATEIDELIALMDQLIYWGGLGDQMQFDLFEVPIKITEKRILVDSDHMHNVLSPYNWTKMGEHIVDARQAFNYTFPQTNPIRSQDVPVKVEQAFLEDFGISFTRICNMVNALGVIAYGQLTPFATLDKNQLKVEVNKIESPFSDLEFESGFLFLSLLNRGKFESIPKEFERFDIHPWRYSRRLSLMRKPLCILNNPDDNSNPIVYWGLRQVLSSRSYLAQQCQTNRLRVRDDGEVNKVLTKINNKAGSDLVLSVISELKNPELIVDSELFIGPDFDLKHHKNIGDIDVLLIDQLNKKIYSLECKNIAASRSFKEMVEEVGKLFEKQWIDKHLVRDNWIKNNLDQLSAKYNLNLSDFKVKSIFITAEEMLTPYLKSRPLPLPFVSLYTLKREGMAAIN
ncbi:SEC-C domain-containing protein [Pedobacter sp. GR22-10]|uniref:SEC-C domain-containing protein n=1 Tax=Pedobacter sp. GR22-10 TaxID=2994472 RepID=UPI0022462877|nr:SEC-C domain-containing protein [Pedobacter sp. GR22-10]MCX2430543.1 SEC-C domain-containing protein [Pedobacter sp. GR22-10]